MNNEKIARICHEVNRAYCQALGDTSQPVWEEAPEWQKESALAGVSFHLSHPEAGADASHANWVAQKLEEGWTRGDVKDPARKQHPCMVPFVDLPVEQQAKDFIFRAIVHALAGEIDTAEAVTDQAVEPAAGNGSEPAAE